MTAVVVMAYDRADALRRLLASLGPVERLVVSIDGDGSALRGVAMPRAAQVVVAGERLQLKEHFFRCGDLSRELGTVVLLEDDLYASPALLDYVHAAMEQYAHVPEIAGVSLYSFCFNEFAETPFAAVDDGYDVYFAQSAGWGLAFTPEQWERFRAWRAARGDVPSSSPLLPHEMNRWPEPTWKRLLNLYLAESGRYLVTPRWGVATNVAEPGVHVRRAVTYLTAPLAAASRRWTMPRFADSLCRYDAHLQLEPASLRAWSRIELPESLALDLYGTRDRRSIAAEWLLTGCPRRAAGRTFALRLFPFETNVIEDIPGHALALARRVDVAPHPDEDTLRAMRAFFTPPWR